jgi:ATP-binding cassette subfamily F protein 3
METEKVRVNFKKALGSNYSKLNDTFVLEYLISLIKDFGEDKKEFEASIAPFLEDVDIDKEDQRDILDELWNSMGFSSQVQPKKGGHKLLAAPIDLQKMSKGIDAEVEKKISHLKFDQSTNLVTQADAKPLIQPKRVQRKERAKPKVIGASVAKNPSSFNKRKAGAMAYTRDIQLKNFDVSIAGRKLLIDSSVNLVSGRKYGLVGRNGFGKTTLFRALSNGEIPLPQGLLVLHVEQEVIGDDTIALDSVLEADVERTELLIEEQELIESEVKSEANDKRLQEIYNRLSEIEADRAPSIVASLLFGLGFSTEMQGMTTKEFSGGWRMRLALARALFCQPDLLLLDQPTNMLDVGAVLWLETYLQTKWKNTLFVISHDREFINSVTTDIYYLHQQILTHYSGNYDQFEETRNEQLRNQRSAHEAQKAQSDHIQEFIDKFRFNAKRASLVQSRLKYLSKMQVIPAVVEDPSFLFEFPNPVDPCDPPVISLSGVCFGYNADKELFRNIDLSIDCDSRLALVGGNGQGKSTLLSLCIGELKPQKGFIQISRKARIAKFSQFHVDQMPLDLSPLEFLMKEYPGKDSQSYRSVLGKYGLSGDLALQKSETLSGGQKSRVVWAHMAMKNPHIMVFDEPTNHLDIETVDVLVQALNSYQGGIVVVSHDERLIKLVCNELWIVHEGTCKPYSGTFDSYKKRLLNEIHERERK